MVGAHCGGAPGGLEGAPYTTLVNRPGVLARGAREGLAASQVYTLTPRSI